jgi:hypothetical protein
VCRNASRHIPGTHVAHISTATTEEYTGLIEKRREKNRGREKEREYVGRGRERKKVIGRDTKSQELTKVK